MKCGFQAFAVVLFAAGAAAAQTLYPAAGAKDVCADTPLKVTFDSAATAGKAGAIVIRDSGDDSIVQTIDVGKPTAVETVGGVGHFNYYPVIIEGKSATIYPASSALKWGKSYYVTIDAGALVAGDKDFGGIAGKSWSFSTKASPAAGSSKVAVAADGTGDFCTVQGALDWAPEKSATPLTIDIHPGVYNELMLVMNKQNLTLQGEDRKKTVLEYANNNRFNPANDQRVYHRGVFLAKGCDNLTISNLTLRDTTPRGGSQAEAIILNGTPHSRAVLKDVDLYSFQDTLQINGQAYLHHCHIEGDVDFMWGTGPCFFEDCTCVITRSKGYFSQIRNPGTNHGYVYYHCRLIGTPGITGAYLSRIDPSVFPYSEVALIDCELDSSVGETAWLLNKSKNAPNVHFWEFNSHDAAGKPVDTSKRLGISKQLKQPEDGETIAHYSDPAWVLGDGWNPR